MKNETKDIIFKWYQKSQLDYSDQFINLFIAYNAWFKKVTKKSKDREAIVALKFRKGIWLQYLDNKTMQELAPYLAEISQITTQRPLLNLTRDLDPNWDGVVKDAKDWEGLIEYWYRVRCNLFHGSKSPEDAREGKLIELAYKSLNVFMTEIICRMNNNFSSEDLNRLFEISLIKHPDESQEGEFGRLLHANYWEETRKECVELNEKFNKAQDLWDVDL